jgi:hypothetical protein
MSVNTRSLDSISPHTKQVVVVVVVLIIIIIVVVVVVVCVCERACTCVRARHLSFRCPTLCILNNVNVHKLLLFIYYYYYYYSYSSTFLTSSSLAGSQKSMGLTNQALLIHCSAKNFLTTNVYSVLLLSTLN